MSRRGRSLVARVAIAACGALLVLTGCGRSGSTAHTQTPTAEDRSAVLSAVDSAFFSTTGDPPDLRLTGLQEVAIGSETWARTTFEATPKAPADTRSALTGGHDGGLLRGAAGGSWTWLGYLAPARATCRTTGRSVPGTVARLLGLAPVCASVPTPNVSPLAAPGARAAETTLSSGDLATLLSIFVTTKNSGPSGQVLTPTTIAVSATSAPRAALVPGGE